MKPAAAIIFLLLISSMGFSQSRTYYTGPKGGCYYLSSSGKKVYVDHSYCYKPKSNSLKSTGNDNTTKSQGTGTRNYLKGPKGGCYYLSDSGKKVYVDRSLCN